MSFIGHLPFCVSLSLSPGCYLFPGICLLNKLAALESLSQNEPWGTQPAANSPGLICYFCRTQVPTSITPRISWDAQEGVTHVEISQSANLLCL